MNNTINSKALQEFKEVSGTLINPALLEWKEKGGKVIGCMYHFIPEEIITAAGLLPFRMRATGSKGTELSESCFTQINCSYVRHLFDSGMRGDQAFLDGVVSVNNCDHIRRLYDNWQSKINTPYMHFLVFPKKSGEEQVEAYRKELLKFKKSLEEAFQVEITDERLREAIERHNETRRLQRKLYNFRKTANPPITGSDIMAAMVAGTAMPKDQYHSLLHQLLEDCANHEGYNGYSARLMLIGGEIDNPEFVEVVESQGGIVVSDLLGYGSRSFIKDVDNTGDPLTSLARYQVMERPADPRIFGRTTLERDTYVKQMVKEYNVDGVVSVRLPLCDPWGFEQVNLSKYLKSKSIPHLPLEIEYILGSTGQIKTRVQAFLETITENNHHANNE